MMQVLSEQQISARRRRPNRGKRRQSRASRGRILQGLSALRTTFLALLTVALGAALVVLVPELEDEAARTAAGRQEAALQATVSSLPAPQSGLVEFERTEDVEYFVEEGETLISIARRYQIDYRLLAEYNELANPDAISVGQRITIPGTTSRRLPRE